MCPLSIPYPPPHHTCAGYRTNREDRTARPPAAAHHEHAHAPTPWVNRHTTRQNIHPTGQSEKAPPRLAPKLMSRSTSRHTICRGEILFWAQNPHNQQHPKTPTSKQSHEKHQENRLVLFLASKLQNSLFPSPLAVGHFRWFHIQYVEGANKCSI